MKVLEPGTPDRVFPCRIKCDNCEALLLVELSDCSVRRTIHKRGHWTTAYYTCPSCQSLQCPDAIQVVKDMLPTATEFAEGHRAVGDWIGTPPDICAPIVMARLHGAPGVRTGVANLHVHQFQVAVSTMLLESAESPDMVAGQGSCFRWAWIAEPCSELETHARQVYQWGVDNGRNHAVVHVAVSGLAQLGRVCGEVWDLGGTGPYVLDQERQPW